MRNATPVSLLLALLVAASCSGDPLPLVNDGGSDTDSDTVADSDTDADSAGGAPMTPADYDDPTPLTWAALDGGVFAQGSADSAYPAEYCETPQHDVAVPPFEVMTTEVTTSQFAQCVLDGACPEPAVSGGSPSAAECNWLVWGRDDHPANCVDALAGAAYRAWLGARLPSEAEWEYAARGGGLLVEFPWGDAEAGCALAVMATPSDGEGCGLARTWPVCSRPAGNTAQGLCDMAGNVKEWVADCWHGSYDGAPADGGAWIDGACEDNVLRGGGYKNLLRSVRTRARSYNPSTGRGDFMGFRCARDAA